MILSDVNKRVVVYDRPKNEGNGVVGIVVEIFDDFRFRIRTDKGIEYEFSTHPRTDGSFTPWVKFIDGQVVKGVE